MDDINTVGDLVDALPQRGIGGNNPPDDITILRERLAEEAAALTARRDELLGSVGRAPGVVSDEDTCGKMADLTKLITACHKQAETLRVGRKEPFLAAGRAVDGFYKGITEPLEKARREIESRITPYQRAKAEEERRRRDEEARRAEAEALRQRQEAEAAASALTTQADLDTAISAEDAARQAAADAVKATRAAEAKPAELSRSRGEMGAVASLRTEWVGEIGERAALDLDALRPHIPLDALEKAVRAYVRAGGRQLRGASIYERSITQVR